MTTYKEFLLENEEKLDMYTKAISKVHSRLHPEVHEVKALYEELLVAVKNDEEASALTPTFDRLVEVTRDFETQEIEIETPMEVTKGIEISGKKVGLVPILRAGLGMVDGMLQLIPGARVGHVGLYRDPETLLPVEYYFKMPKDMTERQLILLDPMLATGGSLSAAATFLKDRGAKNIKAVCILAAPEGIEIFHKEHPEIDLYVASIDRELNTKGYILPGLGDAGDRLFGTK